MKLHLPKQLFTALLAAITLATPATLTLGSAAWGVTSVTTDTTWSGGTSSDADKAGITIDGAEAHLKITDGEYKSVTEKLELKNAGQLTMSGGTLNTLQIHVHNANANTTETLTLTGGTINVSKEDSEASNTSAVLIGHWPSGTGKVLVQGGTLNALNGFVTTGWNSNGILEISGTGVVNAKGVALRRHTDSYVKLSGGRLNVGGSGIVTHNQTSSNPGNLQFLSGTLGTLSDSGWSLGSNITATIGSIIIDTDVWDATTGATATGDAAGSANISLLGELTAASDSASITLAGSGSLTIDHTWDGTIVKASDTTTAKVLIDTGNVAGFDKVLSGGYGNTQASGFATYQIFKSGSTASVYSTANTDNALSLTDGAYSSSDFHVCDTVNYSDITATVSRFYVQQGGTLTLGALGTTTVNDTTKYYIPTPIHNAGNVSLATSTEGVTAYLNDLFGDAAITQTSTGTTTISGTGAVSMNDAVTLAGKVVISGGSFTNNGKNLNGGTGGTLVLQGVSSATLNGGQKIDVNIEVGNGTTLTLSNTDAFNWDHGNKLTVRTGGTVDLGRTRQSLCSSFTVEMAGGTIEGQGGTQGDYLYGLDFYNGGTIRATENSTINTAVGGSQGNGSITVNVDSNKTLTFEGQYAKFSGSKAISKTGAGNVLYKGASFTNALTISGGVFEYYMEDTRAHSASISDAGTFKKSGSGTLKVNGTVGASGAALGSITVNGGNLEILNTSYVTSVNMTGGNLTYGGTDVTHTISEGVTSSNGSQNSTFAVASGSTVNVGSFDNDWGASMVIDGSLVASGAISFASNSTETISGTGSISASSLEVTNHSNYQVSTQQLTIGKDGLTLGNPEGSWGAEKGILSLAGETATINGATNIKTSESALNLNAGSTTIAGAVTNSGSINVKGGSATLNGGISGSGIVALSGGSLILGSGEGITNEIAQFNYSGGTLTHSGLTVTNATFSGGTLDNTANGTLTLTGTLNVTNIVGLTKGEGSYSGGAVEGNGYYTGSLTVITGNNNLSYGDSFEVQLNGTALTDDSTNTSYYTKSENGTLTLNVTDTSTFFVNTGTETTEQAGSTASSFVVAEGATLVLSDDLVNSKTLSLSGTGKLSVVIGTNTDVSHGNNLTASDFNGVVEISKKEGGLGNTNLTVYNLGADASFRLISGNHWSNDNTVFARDIELAGQSVNDFRFAHTGNLTLSGKVTGTYLSAGSEYNYNNFDAGNYENGTANNLILSGEGSDIKYVNMANGTLTVNADMAFGTVNAPTLNIGTGSTLTIGLADTSTTSEIGTLSAAQGALNLKENTLVTLGAGAANAQKVHSLGGISTGTGAGLVLGDYATLQINDIPSALKDDYDKGNTDSASSLQLAIGGGTGSVLELALSARATDDSDWKRNNTVTLSTPTGAASGVGEVRVSSGSLANAVYSGSATTNLNGAALRMADGTSIILRKANSSENLGAGDITLEGTTELFNYNITGTLTNNISGNKLNITNQGNVTLTGNVNLQALQMGIDTTLGDGVNERTYTLGEVTATSGTTLTVSKNATLNHLSSVTGTVTLAGSGVYELQDGAITMTSGVSLSTSWTGTVRISNVAYDGTTVNNNKMETMASTAGSGKLMLTNVNGWLGTATMSKHLILENGTGGEAALYLSNGSSNNNETKTAKFSEGISGTGDIQFNWNKSGVSNCTIAHEISGDTASWSGKFISNESGSLDVQVDFTKGGEVFSSTVDGGGVENRTDNKLLVNIGSSVSDTSFNGSIGKTSGAGAVELNVTHNNVTFNKEVNVDKLTVTQGASAQLGNTMTVGGVSFSACESATAESPAKLLANGSSALAQLQADASFTIQDMTLSNVKLSAVEGASVALTNVSATNTLLAGGGDFTLNATPTVEAAVNDTTTGRISYTCGLGVESGSSLTLNLDVINAVRPNQHGTYDLTITLSGFGSDFRITSEEAILGMVKFDASSWLAQALEEQGAVWHAEIAESTENTVVTQSSVPTVTYSAGENVGTLVITINGLNVPEPATSTLSLLALAALAARRRRK